MFEQAITLFTKATPKALRAKGNETMPLYELAKLNRTPRDVVFRVDVNGSIGSGHAVRCMAIADSIEQDGGAALFAVSDAASASTLLEAGKECVVVPGDFMRFGTSDGKALGVLANDLDIASIFVDSYAVTDAFFKGLRDATDRERKIAWIDDLYTYELGEESAPVARQVDCVVNYSLGMSLSEYERTYAATGATLCIDPRYAPLRPQFSRYEGRTYESVNRIMVTTGSTNEGQMLERMVGACLCAIPSAQVDVVVGSLASFTPFDDERVVERRGITNLAPLMRESDICVCAAGTTLYELSSVGVPSIAIPIVKNQLPNAAGFKGLGLGLVVNDDAHMEEELTKVLGRLASNPKQRRAFVSKMHRTVDGNGASRIATELQYFSGNHDER